MKLSVIIVNYNVEFFLEQCLSSVRRSMQGIDGEVFVVDNNSVDGSLKMVANKFPEVKVIANKENLGFSRANNQAIRISTGEYVLLLNPDTVVEDDTFSKCIAFMDSHPDAGGLGVKMMDGKGNFLPESKRGLPTPEAAFYKMFGLTKLFPHSKRFARYYMGHLSCDETNECEILAGAFMMMRRETLDKVGLLDETFFMYGEDIDLSYRITQGGYKNYYFPETRIIHYKGESTKKTSVNYVFVFYKAMEIFAKKHFGQKRAFWFSFFINLAIYFKAFLALLSQFFHKIAIPFLDALLGYAGLAVISYYWGRAIIYDGTGNYPITLFAVVLPAYVLIWLISTYFAGGYDKPYSIPKGLFGIAAGSVFVLMLYALVPETLRFSRSLILLGTLWFALEMSITRLIGISMGKESFLSKRNARKRFIIIGSLEETHRVESLIQSTSIKPDFIGLVSSDAKGETPDGFIGRINQVPDIITIYKITEVIFCSKDVPHQVIIDKMVEWHATNVDYKIAPEDSLSIIGSNSINTRGDLYTVDIKAIDTVANRRNKRLLDVVLSGFSLVFWLPLALVVRKPIRFLKDAVLVLFGRRTWVGYCNADNEIQKLPKIRRGIFTPATPIEKLGTESDAEFHNKLNLLYARDYTVWKDAEIFFRSVAAKA
ncbi:MAG: glycosyltransferase [Bacteroidales bacterium]|nr:glycosyltransferase [Bacteroidales bacterium]